MASSVVPLLRERGRRRRRPARRSGARSARADRRASASVPQIRLRSSRRRRFRARSAPPSDARDVEAGARSPTRPGWSGARTAAASRRRSLGREREPHLGPVRRRGSPRSAPTDRRLASADQHNGRSMTTVEERAGSGGRGVSEEVLRGFFREMLLIRRFEEKVEERFRAGELPGFLHVAIGQEATATGVCAALDARGRHRVDAPRARPCDREGHAGRADHGRALRQGRGLQRRLRRLDAPLRPRGRKPRRERGRRRRASRDRRRSARVPDARRDARRRRVLRRRRDEHGHVPRVAEPRAALEGAGDLRPREQRLGGVDAGEPAAPASRRRAGQARARRTA